MPTPTNEAVEHRLNSRLLTSPVRVVVVGCGGTGSAIASGLPYLHQAMLAHGHPGGLSVVLCDGDRISATNTVRQPFAENEIGQFKASVLAHRVNLFWGFDWKAVNAYLDKSATVAADLVISCVDTRAARARIRASVTVRQADYWLDLGNTSDSGQFVLGEPVDRRPNPSGVRLPTVDELFPEIVQARLDRQDRLPSCSAVEALARQEPFINQVLAFQALALLARLFRHGRLNHHGGFMNLVTGRLTALPVDPRVWAQMRERSARKSA